MRSSFRAEEIWSPKSDAGGGYEYHTMHNRQVRVIDLKKINFATVREQIIDDDAGPKHPVRELTVK